MYDKTPKYSVNQVKQMIGEAIEATGYFESQKFSEEYLNMYNNWPEPDQIERAQEKFIENFIN